MFATTDLGDQCILDGEGWGDTVGAAASGWREEKSVGREAIPRRGEAVRAAAEFRLAGLVLLSEVCLLCLVLLVTGAFRLLLAKETCRQHGIVQAVSLLHKAVAQCSNTCCDVATCCVKACRQAVDRCCQHNRNSAADQYGHRALPQAMTATQKWHADSGTDRQHYSVQQHYLPTLCKHMLCSTATIWTQR